MTLRSYLELIKWEDTTHAHRFFYNAASSLVKVEL